MSKIASQFLSTSCWLSVPAKTPDTNHRHFFYGGGERDRTDDPLLAKQVLSQLSYTPTEIRIANLVKSK